MGADVVVGSSQRFGVPLFYGGPHAGYMSVAAGPRAAPARAPGRVCRSTPRAVRPTGWRCRPVSSTSAATRPPPTSAPPRCCSPWSPRCTPCYHGPEGLRAIATRTHRYAAVLAAALHEAGHPVAHERFFDTLTVPVPGRAAEVVGAARELGLHLRLVDADTVGIATSETTTAPRWSGCCRRSRRAPAAPPSTTPASRRSTAAPPTRCPTTLRRSTDYLTHEVFSLHRSETQMLRYLRRLSARDYALDRGMIPLGSCTMKLNATTEMEPVSLPGFADLHPFAPAEDAAGLPRARRPARGVAGRGHRLRPGLHPAQRRLAG